MNQPFADINAVAHALKHDTVHGLFDKKIAIHDNNLCIEGKWKPWYQNDDALSQQPRSYTYLSTWWQKNSSFSAILIPHLHKARTAFSSFTNPNYPHIKLYSIHPSTYLSIFSFVLLFFSLSFLHQSICYRLP